LGGITIAQGLGIEVASFVAMVMAAEQQRSPREILMSAIAELD
jgi:hypothetical protein